jgi:hypothetical protein
MGKGRQRKEQFLLKRWQKVSFLPIYPPKTESPLGAGWRFGYDEENTTTERVGTDYDLCI